MTSLTLAQNEKAEVQIDTFSNWKVTFTQEHVAISCRTTFAEVKHLVESAPPPRRPNRNRPLAPVKLDDSFLKELDERATPPCNDWLNDKSWPE